MASRIRVIVALSGLIKARPGQSGAQRLTEQRTSTQQVKGRVLQRLEQLRRLDPDLRVFGAHLFTPMLELDTNRAVIAALADDEDVLEITSEAPLLLQGQMLGPR